MFEDKVKSKGTVTFVKTSPDGIEERQEFNLLTDVGKDFITAKLIGLAGNDLTHMALGTDATAAAGGQTALGAETGRVGMDSAAQVTTTVTNDSAQFVATFDAGVATGAITEAGLFDAASAGSMPARTSFPVVNKQELDSLAVTWKIVIL